MYPARWFYRGHEQEPTTEVALRRSASDDLYLVLAGYEVQNQEATLQVHINPLVNWIWLGVGVMLIAILLPVLRGMRERADATTVGATIFTALPDTRARRPGTTRCPLSAVRVCLLPPTLCLCRGSRLQHRPRVGDVERVAGISATARIPAQAA